RCQLYKILARLIVQLGPRKGLGELIERPAAQSHRRKLTRKLQTLIGFNSKRRLNVGKLAPVPYPGQPFNRNLLERRVPGIQKRREEPRALRMGDARERVERSLRKIALSEIPIESRQRFDPALVAHRPERLHRRSANRAIVVIERRDNRVAKRLIDDAV